MAIGDPIEQAGAVKPSSLEQQAYEPDLFANRTTEIPSNMQMRIEWDGSGNAIYIGYAPMGLATTSDKWLLQKFSYDGSNRCTLRQISYDAWDSRASATFS